MTRLRLLLPLLLLPACAQQAAPPQQRVPVTVGTAERQDVPFELAATGTVEPLQTVAVQPQIGGPIVRVAFREGQDVEKGQILFQIDPRPYQAALAQAEALLARDRAQASNAEQEAKRYAELAQREYVTAQQYDQARTVSAAAAATLAGSEAEVEEARLNLQYATIRAPISGRTGSLRVREGNLVRAADAGPLVTINQIRPILVRFAVPAAKLPLIQRYRSEPLVVRAEPVGGGDASEGELAFVDNAVDTTTGTILLKGTLRQRRRRALARRVRQRAAAAVRRRGGSRGAGHGGGDRTAGQLRLRHRRRQHRRDEAGEARPDRSGETTIVEGELEPGQRVVVDGQLRLQQGSKVQIKSAADSAARGST